jgi:hypothetical protein
MLKGSTNHKQKYPIPGIGKGRVWDILVTLRVKSSRFDDGRQDGAKKLANIMVVLLAATFFVILMLGQRHWAAMQKAQLSNVKEYATVTVTAGMNTNDNSLSSTDKLAPVTDETKKAVHILQNAGMIQSPDYWIENAREAQTVKGEYAALLMQNVAQKHQRK